MSGCVSDSADDDSQPVSDTSEGQSPLEVRLQEAVDGLLSSRLAPGASVAVIDGGELTEVVSGMADPTSVTRAGDNRSRRPTSCNGCRSRPTLVTTATEAAAFAHALFSGDVLGPTTLAEMLDTGAMRGLPCPAECPFEYGLGVFHYELAGHELVGHDGSSGTIVVRDQRRDLTVAILTNGGEQDIGAFLETVISAVDETDG